MGSIKGEEQNEENSCTEEIGLNDNEKSSTEHDEAEDKSSIKSSRKSSAKSSRKSSIKGEKQNEETSYTEEIGLNDKEKSSLDHDEAEDKSSKKSSRKSSAKSSRKSSIKGEEQNEETSNTENIGVNDNEKLFAELDEAEDKNKLKKPLIQKRLI